MSQYLRYFGAVSFSISLLTLSSVSPIDFTFVQSQIAEGQFPESIIASTSTDTTPHLLKLKVTQEEGAVSQEVSGFNLDITNAISAQASSQLLIVVTDTSVRVIEAKARTASNQFIDLVPSTSPQATNAFSLANLPEGVYTLDVITQKGNTKAAYEGILAIGQQPATIIEETINRESGDNIIIIPPNDEPSPPSPPPGPPSDEPPSDEPPSDEPPSDDGNGNGGNGNGGNGNGGSLFDG